MASEPDAAPEGQVARILRFPIHRELVARLRDAIVEGELPEGSKLSERILCESLGVSRSPLREALRALASEGLVELLPNRGARVAQLSASETRHIMEVVTLLESAAVQQACRRMGDDEIAEIGELHYRMARHLARGELRNYFAVNLEIHQKLVDAARNPVLSDTYRNLNSRVRRFRYLSHAASGGSTEPAVLETYRKSLGEHEKMLRAVLERDGDRLATLIREHYKLEPATIEVPSTHAPN